MWEQLHIVFKKHNGVRKNDLEPEKTTKAPCVSKGNANKVVFSREEEARGQFKYKIYKAQNKDDAIAFLSLQKVTKKMFYIVVETPEGNFGRDVDGIYEE